MTARTLDLVVGALSLLGAIFIFSISRSFPDRAALMPSLISGIMAFASLAMILKAFKRSRDGKSAFSNVSWLRLGLTISAWFTLIILSKWINFFILSAIFLFSIAVLLNGKPKNAKELTQFVAFSAGVSIVLWLLFSLVLNVNFPVEGIFFN